MGDRPVTQKDQIAELWDQVNILTNKVSDLWSKLCNGNGLIERFEAHVKEDREQQTRIEESLASLNMTTSTLVGKLEGHMDTAKPSRAEIDKQKLKEVTRVAFIVTGIPTVALLAFLLLYFGVVQPQWFVDMINAARGG